ncbi:MAG: hypothetical protein HYX32_10340 [Actinobacteria bacterium]|nr:hypothetical protein [Actinomycetota bacterium]
MALDLTNLSARDAIVALKSYPRRFAESIEPINDDNVEAFASRPGPDGQSALDIAWSTAQTLADFRESLREVLVETDPELATLAQPSTLPSVAPPTMAATIGSLRREADALAEAIGHVDANSWKRTGTIAATGRTVTALDVVRDAVRIGSDNLRRADAAMAAARSGG